MSILLSVLKDMVGLRRKNGEKAAVFDHHADQSRLRFLNVGGGSKKIEVPAHFTDWEHVLLDIDATGGPDVICDARDLMRLNPEQYDAVYCSHNLEHYYLHDARKVLQGFLHVLKSEGFAEIRVPDMAALLRDLFEREADLHDVAYGSKAGPITYHDVIWGFGKQIEQSGVDFYAHKSGFFQRSLNEILIQAGFECVFAMPPSGIFELHVIAFKTVPSDERLDLLGLSSSSDRVLYKRGRDQRQHAEIETNCREVILGREPDCAVTYNNLGVTLQSQGKYAEAEVSCRQAIWLEPNMAEAHCNLATVLISLGRYAEAEASYREAIRLNPGYAEAYSNLGSAQADQGRLVEGEASCREAIRLKPQMAEAHNNLGNILRNQSERLHEAEVSLREAIRLKPDFAVAHNNLGKVLKDLGRLSEAESSYREALRLKPDYAEAHSNLLLALLYSSHGPERIWLEHQKFAEKFEAPLKSGWHRHLNLPDPNRRLKIGYVSGDFRNNHPVAFFIEPILAHRDKRAFEVFAYHNHVIRDMGTERIAAHVDKWFDCVGVDDESLAKRIQDDGIDILIDLSGHTAHNRLLVFARKPAPVQVTWVGYLGTSGLEAMDYRLTSESLDPPGFTERYHSERLVRLPEFAGYEPFAEAPEINKLPALENDKFVLACLNNPTKINTEVIGLWTRILNRIPQARLILGNAADSAVRDWLVDEFFKEGVDEQRLILQPRLPMKDYLALHHQIDLALDPFPYNGGATSMHSLWMGVPFVTLSGNTTQSRMGVSVLKRAGLESFIANSNEEYIQRVLYWSEHLLLLNQIRGSLRDRIKFVDKKPDAFVSHIETAYRWIWSQWCEKQK